jgi:hypothetical protein
LHAPHFLVLLLSSGFAVGQTQTPEIDRATLSEIHIGISGDQESLQTNNKLLHSAIDSLGTPRIFPQSSYEEAKAKTLADIESRQIITPGLDPESIPSFQTLLDIPNKNPPLKDRLYSSQKFSQSPNLIIFMTFENGVIQALAFDRLYAFVESKWAGKISDDESLSVLATRGASVEGIDGGGHDYKSVDIARFYSQAEGESFSLNAVEKRLLEDLLSSKLLVKVPTGYEASSNFALLGVSQYGTNADREHEFNHGVYFTDDRYRSAAERLWISLSSNEKNLVNQVMDTFRAYNFKNDHDLFLREFIAFFRDPEDLKKSYLQPIGFDKALCPQLENISKKIKALDSTSKSYQEMLQARQGERS